MGKGNPPYRDETEGFQCLGLSNWTICSLLSQSYFPSFSYIILASLQWHPSFVCAQGKLIPSPQSRIYSTFLVGRPGCDRISECERAISLRISLIKWRGFAFLSSSWFWRFTLQSTSIASLIMSELITKGNSNGHKNTLNMFYKGQPKRDSFYDFTKRL